MSSTVTHGAVSRLRAALVRLAVPEATQTRILAPAELLDALGARAPGALGDDVLAAEALRRVLGLGAGLALPIGESEEPEGSTAELLAGAGPVDGCDGGMIDLGLLVGVAVAAARVGAATSLDAVFVEVVFGAARACMLAELLLRALDDGASDEELALLVRLAADTATSRPAALVPAMVADPGTGARWRLIAALRTFVRKITGASGGLSAPSASWDGAVAAPVIARVSPRYACPSPGAELVVTLEADAPRAEIAGADKKKALFAMIGRLREPVVAVRATYAEDAVRFALPEGARPGWIGLSWPTLQARARNLREAVRKALQALDKSGALGVHVPHEWVRALPEMPVPPRTSAGLVLADLPALHLSVEPSVVRAGDPLTIRWWCRGAEEVVLEPGGAQGASGELTIAADELRPRIEIVARARSTCGEVSAAATVRVRARIASVSPGSAPWAGEPLDLQVIVAPPDAAETLELVIGGVTIAGSIAGDVGAITIPAELMTGEVAGRIALRFGKEVDDEAEVGPWAAMSAPAGRFAVVRPAVLEPAFARADLPLGPYPARPAHTSEVHRGSGPRLDLFEPPWVTDAVLTVARAPSGADSPATRAILAALDGFAARCPGFEDATWLAVLPEGESSFVAIASGSAARSVAVATADRVAEVLTAAPGPESGPSLDRLRLTGEIRPGDDVRLDLLVEERRAAGPGAPHDLGLDAMAVDEDGRPLSRVPVTALSDLLPVGFCALLPADPAIVAVEIRRRADGAILARAKRPEGRPHLEAERTTEGVRWRWLHDRGARPRLWLEAGGEGGWCALPDMSACAHVVRLPDVRRDVRWRLAGTDGWHQGLSDLGDRAASGLPIVRIDPRGGFAWADVDDPDAQLVWAADGATGTGFLFAVPAGARSVVLRQTVGGETFEVHRDLREAR